MRLFALTLAVTALAAVPAKAGPDNLADCYELAILECGLVWGGQDWGDDDYKHCINDQFDICDALFNSTRGGRDSFKAPQSTKPLRLKSG